MNEVDPQDDFLLLESFVDAAEPGVTPFGDTDLTTM